MPRSVNGDFRLKNGGLGNLLLREVRWGFRGVKMVAWVRALLQKWIKKKKERKNMCGFVEWRKE